MLCCFVWNWVNNVDIRILIEPFYKFISVFWGLGFDISFVVQWFQFSFKSLVCRKYYVHCLEHTSIILLSTVSVPLISKSFSLLWQKCNYNFDMNLSLSAFNHKALRDMIVEGWRVGRVWVSRRLHRGETLELISSARCVINTARPVGLWMHSWRANRDTAKAIRT